MYARVEAASKKPLIFYYVIIVLVIMMLNATLFPMMWETPVQEVDYTHLHVHDL